MVCGDACFVIRRDPLAGGSLMTYARICALPFSFSQKSPLCSDFREDRTKGAEEPLGNVLRYYSFRLFGILDAKLWILPKRENNGSLVFKIFVITETGNVFTVICGLQKA